MSIVDQINVLILTYNEAPNIRRTLEKLKWASRILIVDSGSTDDTVQIAGLYPQTQVVHRAFDDFATQCNFGLSLLTTDWVLSLDADYELSQALVDEIEALDPENTSGYQARFIYRVYGRELRGTLYPPRTILYRKDRARYRNEGHGHRVSVDGAVADLTGKIYHDDRKSLSRWFASQQQYARREADHLLESSRDSLNRVDRIRLLAWPAPLAVFCYALILKGCIFDGWPGWFYVLQRTTAELIIAIELIDRRLPHSQATLPKKS